MTFEVMNNLGFRFGTQKGSILVLSVENKPKIQTLDKPKNEFNKGFCHKR